MAVKGGRTTRYIVGHPPTNSDEGLYTYNECTKIFDWMRQPIVPEITVEILNSPPSKPNNGRIVYADGTNWNPGAGEGFYGYQAGSWVKL